MKIDTEIRSKYKIKQNIREQIKEHIQERMEKHIENFQKKRKTKTNNTNATDQDNFNKLMDHVFNNKTNFETEIYKLPSKYNSLDLKEFKNSTDYEQMWEIAIDKWTRNWNLYREQLTDSILEKFQLNNKRNKRQTKEDYVELKGQNINGSAVGPQDIFIEHYDCDAEEITNVKYYELNKISTCKFKPLDLEMTKTEVQLLSKAQAVEIKAYAVTGTIKEKVEWCSQHTHYIRANRPSYYVSDARRTKILDPDEVRNELARINLLKNTKYRPTRHNISFNYLSNPPLQKRLENVQGNIQFNGDTPMVPPYGRLVYDYTNPMWVPNEIKNAQSNCLSGVKKQNRIDILDWTLEIKEVSLILNLDTKDISYMGTKLPCDLRYYEFRLPRTCNFDFLVAKASQDLSAYSAFTQQHQIFQLSFNLLHPTPKDVQSNNYRVHETKLIHNLIYYTFLRDKQYTASKSFIHINDQLTSPYFLNYSYRIKWSYTIGTLRNFDPIKNYYVFQSKDEPERPLMVPSEALEPCEEYHVYHLTGSVTNRAITNRLNSNNERKISETEKEICNSIHASITETPITEIVNLLGYFLSKDEHFLKEYKH